MLERGGAPRRRDRHRYLHRLIVLGKRVVTGSGLACRARRRLNGRAVDDFSKLLRHDLEWRLPHQRPALGREDAPDLGERWSACTAAAA